MTTMVSELYTALKAAGAPEEQAAKAAEAVAGYENRFNKVEQELAILKFMVGLVLAGVVSLMLKAFFAA